MREDPAVASRELAGTVGAQGYDGRPERGPVTTEPGEVSEGDPNIVENRLLPQLRERPMEASAGLAPEVAEHE